MMHPDTIQRLRNFRNELYMLFGKRADALFIALSNSRQISRCRLLIHG